MMNEFMSYFRHLVDSVPLAWYQVIHAGAVELHLQRTYDTARWFHLSQERGSHIIALIGNALVANLKPGLKPYEVRDTRLKGFLLRVQPSGIMSWYVEYGRGRRIRVGRADSMKPTQARERAKEILGEAYSGKDPAAGRRKVKNHTFRSFIDEVYAPWAEQNIRTARETLRRLTVDFPDLQDKKLDEITPWLVEKWRMSRLKGGLKPSSVNRVLNDLKASLAKAVLWGHLEVHPIASVKRLRIDSRPVVRFLTREEEMRLRAVLDRREARIRTARVSANAWRAAQGYPLMSELRQDAFANHLKPMVLLSLNTGLRRGELFGLTWADVDLAAGNLTIHGYKAKSGHTRYVPLNAEARAVLDQWREQASDRAGFVFPAADGKRFDNVRKSWLKLLEEARIEGFRWHDLRHTFASRLVMARVDLNTVRELLGHSTYRMTLRYAHLAPEHKAAAVARLTDGE